MVAGSRVASILIRRGIFLTVSLVLIVLLAAVIMGATGYDTKVLMAMVEQQVQAYRQSLQRQGMSFEAIEEAVKEYRQELVRIYQLDRPWYERLLPMTIRTLTLDLNVTIDTVADVAGMRLPARVGDVIFTVLPRTIIMLTIAEIICAAIALPLGPFIAYRRGSILDRGVVAYAAITHAFPVWWLGMIAIFFFGYQLKIAPTNYRAVISHINSFWEDPYTHMMGILYYAYLPILVVVIGLLGGWLYSVRAVAIRVVSEDYVMVARAKGLPENLVVRRYILRVIAGTVMTFVILGLAGSIGGFIITETVFDWPGMGMLYYQAIIGGDSPTVLGLVYVTTIVYIIGRFILEILYIILDPRVRL